MSTLPTTDSLLFTPKNRDEILANNAARQMLARVMRDIIATSDPDVNSRLIHNPRLNYRRAIGTTRSVEL